VIYLLDNNVLSELWKPTPDPAVQSWFYAAEWFLPVPVVAEIQEGAEAAPSTVRRLEITRRLDAFLEAFGQTVIGWDAETART
jgi:predicted nucleic acid-binding protein